MRPWNRLWIVQVLLVLSVLCNAMVLGYLAKSGGLRRIFMKLDLAELPVTRAEFQQSDEKRYRKYPNTAAEIVFAGDSHVNGGHWAEFFGEIHNRGIGGEMAKGLLGRIDEVTESKPRKIFLWLGTNEMAAQVPIAQYLRQYRELLERIRKDSPETQITVFAVLPVNNTLPVKQTFDNAKVQEANAQLKELVTSFPGVRFVDLNRYLVDPSGNLRSDFSSDGCHLNVDGYLAIREPLQEFVNDPAPARTVNDKSKP